MDCMLVVHTTTIGYGMEIMNSSSFNVLLGHVRASCIPSSISRCEQVCNLMPQICPKHNVIKSISTEAGGAMKWHIEAARLKTMSILLVINMSTYSTRMHAGVSHVP